MLVTGETSFRTFLCRPRVGSGMNWYTVSFPNRQEIYANSPSREELRELLLEVYAFSGRYSTTREDVERATITEAPVESITEVKNRLSRKKTPFQALDETTPEDDSDVVTLWESRTNTAGQDSLNTSQMHRYDDPDSDETARF